MSPTSRPSPRSLWVAGAIALVAAAGGYGLAQLEKPKAPTASEAGPPGGKKVLYWYDPMVPQQHFPAPGKSPMGMDMVPKYADQGAGEVGFTIDPARVANLGVRIAVATRGELASGVTATGTIDFNLRDIAIVQPRAAGFVQRVYSRAPGDIIPAGAPLADLLVPEWGGAQAEYLAVRRTGDPALLRAAQERLRLLGMSPGFIRQIDQTGRAQTVVTVTAPIGGVIKTLNVRNGMSVSAGETLAEISGLGTVWLNAAVPEVMAGQVRPGQPVTATLAAYPGESFSGRVTAVLPQAQVESRTLQVRIELPNRGARLKPGMFANVQLTSTTRAAILIPTEAIIRTGKRSLVMLALAGGRYQPAEVQIGQSAGDKTEILAGLSEGERIVASGQFLIDSEASLSGVQARPIGGAMTMPASPPAAPKPAAPTPAGGLAETSGHIESIGADGVTISHQPVPAIGWPAMTMTFRVEQPTLLRGVKKGDRVRFAFDQPAAGPTLRRLSKEAGQ
jgi:Cu(I)/Ag(I) efflux system membrane fusion protein